ncbi:iron-sulfur cluster assembly accessory protein [Chloroflexia bacterium SDU3-3]|nr:iron-sulfur cluster assembly accessory protein [Chloroflexia bacterium SDU3-3]
MAISELDITARSGETFVPMMQIEETAAKRLLEMMGERELDGYALRVFISGGGCSGLQYGMTFDDEVREGDTEWTAHSLRVLVDPVSAQYLHGANISFQQDNMLAGAFKIDNPNAASSCGCGHSFRAKDGAEGADESYDEGYAGGGCGHCNHG